MMSGVFELVAVVAQQRLHAVRADLLGTGGDEPDLLLGEIAVHVLGDATPDASGLGGGEVRVADGVVAGPAALPTEVVSVIVVAEVVPRADLAARLAGVEVLLDAEPAAHLGLFGRVLLATELAEKPARPLFASRFRRLADLDGGGGSRLPALDLGAAARRRRIVDRVELDRVELEHALPAAGRRAGSAHAKSSGSPVSALAPSARTGAASLRG